MAFLIPKQTSERIAKQLKLYQGVLQNAHDRDVKESDTVVIIGDMLNNLFGYARYSEVTTEQAVRSKFCDLAVKLDGEVRLLIEAKAIGITLKQNHVTQAIDYAANKGTEWVLLTNGIEWQVFRMKFAQPIDYELILRLNILQLNSRVKKDIETLYLLTREGMKKGALDEFYSYRQATDRFSVAAILMTEPIMKAVRKELKGLYPDIKVEVPDIMAVLKEEVLKREVVDGEQAKAASAKIRRVAKKKEKAKEGIKSGMPDQPSELVEQDQSMEN